jgi:hypothetical protein
MPAHTPAVVDRELIDIDFSSGLNEAVRPESMDWTHGLKNVENLDFNTRGVMKSRKGLYSVSDENDYNVAGVYSVTPMWRLLASSRGLLAIGTNALGASTGGGTISVNEYSGIGPTVQSNTKASLTAKGAIGQFSVKPFSAGSVVNSTPRMIGTAYTSRYSILVTTDTVDCFVYFLDPATGHAVRSYQINYATSTGSVCLVDARYLHVYLGQSASAKVFQFDTESLPEAVPSGTALTSGTYVVSAQAGTSFSIVVMLNGNLSKVNTSAAETATGSVAGFDTNKIHDMAGDGTNFYIVGLNSTPRGLMKVINSSLTTTRTVTDTDATLSAARFCVGVDSSSNCKLLAQFTTTLGSFSMATVRVLTCSSAASVFTSNLTLPGWGVATSPNYNSTTARWYAALIDLPDAGLGAGHSLTTVAGNCVLVDFDAIYSNSTQLQYSAAAVLDRYTEYGGAYNAGLGNYLSNAGPQKLFSADSGKTYTMSTIQKIGTQAYSAEFRILKLADATSWTVADDVISGGVTSSYDGSVVSELGFLQTPSVYAVDAGAGTGVDLGLHSYLAVWEHVDSAGRRHLSKCSNPFSLTLGAAKNVTVYLNFPAVTAHRSAGINSSGGNVYNIRYHIYRTVTGGTQYYRVTTGIVTGIAATTASITYTDSTSDASLVSNELLHRQPGTPGTALDRYSPLASSCSCKHKDRVFVARGSNVYYSSFAVDNEAYWFNPALSFTVPGAQPITAIASMEGTLVVFSANGIWLVDGDGPPENGGSGLEFSPPRRLLTDYGCSDPRTLVSTPNGLMYRSKRGIETLTRRFQVEWTGERVKSALTTYAYHGGAAFDPMTGRAVWIVGNGAGTYPGELQAGGGSGGTGIAVVYNTQTDAWTKYKLRNSLGYGSPFQDVAYAEVGNSALSIASAGRLVFLDYSKVWLESGYVDHDSADAFVQTLLETGWVKSQSKQDRLRVSELILTGQRNADCTVTGSYAANYGTSYTSVSSFTPTVTGALTVVELGTQPPVEAVQAMSFKLATSDPTPTSFGSGQQFDIYGLTVRLGVRGGGRKLPSTQKG